jgi:mono/diheme cytochrome c family protein
MTTKFITSLLVVIGVVGFSDGMALAAPPSGVTAAGVTLTSVSVVFPGSANTFPPGPGGAQAGAMLANANCLTCHSAGMVLNQPNLTKVAWHAEVMKMIKEFQAPIAAGDVPGIADYLASIKGQQ